MNVQPRLDSEEGREKLEQAFLAVVAKVYRLLHANDDRYRAMLVVLLNALKEAGVIWDWDQDVGGDGV